MWSNTYCFWRVLVQNTTHYDDRRAGLPSFFTAKIHFLRHREQSYSTHAGQNRQWQKLALQVPYLSNYTCSR